MASAGIALKDFFDLSTGGDTRPAAESGQNIASLKDTLSRRAPLVKWPAAREEILSKTGELLDIGFPEIAVAAWQKYLVLRKYADTERYPPNETVVVPLATHTIRSLHRPHIDVLVGDQTVGKVHFEIDVELTLQGVLLSIRGGKVIEIRVGSCQAKGRVSCEGAVIAERETKAWLLPGAIPLGDGIPISVAMSDEPRADV